MALTTAESQVQCTSETGLLKVEKVFGNLGQGGFGGVVGPEQSQVLEGNTIQGMGENHSFQSFVPGGERQEETDCERGTRAWFES